MRKALLVLLLATAAAAQQHPRSLHPRDADIHDADTKAWWHTTEALSGDDMEGRDTGSAAYQRAADYVAARFKNAGLKPAGDNGTYIQQVPMHEVAVDKASFTIVRNDGTKLPIEFLQQITIVPAGNLPTEAKAALTFRGYCGKEAMMEVAGKIVVCFGTQRAGLPSGAERGANAHAGHALGVLTIDDAGFTIEPPRWPAAYARTVALGPVPYEPHTAPDDGYRFSLRMTDAAFAGLIQGTGNDAAAILKAGAAKQPLASFDIPAQLAIQLTFKSRQYSSPNILATLPGTDLKDQTLVLSAHLDGYGYGTAVAGDNLYNGALDDAAYVALLIQFADDLKGKPLKRSVLFAAFTGEEKGLLGSTYFTQHPTVPESQLAADINLDQLRPLFPLTLLTIIGGDGLSTIARRVGEPMGIAFQSDPEPERGLVRRADHAPFMKIGVPAIGFIFGYTAGTDAERRYREWYQIRYHRPQDDVTQPMNFDAAAKFNSFFYSLATAVANESQRPHMMPGPPHFVLVNPKQ